MSEVFSKEKIFIQQFPGIIYEMLIKGVLSKDRTCLTHLLCTRLLDSVGGKFSLLLHLEGSRLVSDGEIYYPASLSGPEAQTVKLSAEVQELISKGYSGGKWREEALISPHASVYDEGKMTRDDILSELATLGVKSCLRVPIKKTRPTEQEPVMGFALVLTDDHQDKSGIGDIPIADSIASSFAVQALALEEIEAREVYGALVNMLTTALNNVYPITQGHSERVKAYCTIIADRLGLAEESRENLGIAALLHDIGKLQIRPYWIAAKPGRFVGDEQEKFEKHPELGADLVAKVSMPEEVASAIKYHHKEYNGGGYPEDGVKGKEISPLARIIAVACAFDRYYWWRGYKLDGWKGYVPIYDAKWALEKLREDAKAGKLDEEIVEAFAHDYEEKNEDERKLWPLYAPAEVPNLSGTNLKERLALGNEEAQAKRYRQALDFYEAALKLASENAALHLFVGNFALEKVKDAEAAVKHYTHAIEIEPRFAVAYFRRAQAERKGDNLGAAFLDCERAIALIPTYIEAYLLKGDILHVQHKAEEAYGCFKEALKLDSRDAEVHLGIADVHFVAGNYEDADEWCQKAIDLGDGGEVLPSAYLMMSRISMVKKQPDEAKKFLKLAEEAAQKVGNNTIKMMAQEILIAWK
ncbi:HD domain-containing protein [Candidatus Poribacteria bacterium]|nr:HD domain-containing protein [Candidatus Poribacteria bacterium]